MASLSYSEYPQGPCPLLNSAVKPLSMAEPECGDTDNPPSCEEMISFGPLLGQSARMDGYIIIVVFVEGTTVGVVPRFGVVPGFGGEQYIRALGSGPESHNSKFDQFYCCTLTESYHHHKLDIFAFLNNSHEYYMGACRGRQTRPH